MIAAALGAAAKVPASGKAKGPKGEEKEEKKIRRYKFKNTMVEIFRVKEKGCPFEHMELQRMVIHFAWEPTPIPGTGTNPNPTTRFAMISGELPFPDVGVWQVPHVAAEGVDTGLDAIVTLERRKANQIYWSPNGGVMLLAAYVTNHEQNGDLGKALNGQLEFYDVDERATLAERSHYRCNCVSWDPSGRTVATAVTQPIEGGHYLFSVDNGYMFWTFQGFPLGSEVESKESFHQFKWRPRPRTLLSEDDKKKVIKKLRKYERRFERADREKQRAKQLSTKIQFFRRRQEMRQRREVAYQRLQDQREERLSLYPGGYDPEDPSNFTWEEVVVHTEVIESKEVQEE